MTPDQEKRYARRLYDDADELRWQAIRKAREANSYFMEHLDDLNGDYTNHEHEHNMWIAMSRTQHRLEALADAKQLEADRAFNLDAESAYTSLGYIKGDDIIMPCMGMPGASVEEETADETLSHDAKETTPTTGDDHDQRIKQDVYNEIIDMLKQRIANIDENINAALDNKNLRTMLDTDAQNLLAACIIKNAYDSIIKHCMHKSDETTEALAGDEE